MADKILSDKAFNFAKKSQPMERAGVKADNTAVCVAICSSCIGMRMAMFLLFVWQDQIFACSML